MVAPGQIAKIVRRRDDELPDIGNIDRMLRVAASDPCLPLILFTGLPESEVGAVSDRSSEAP
jgi:hypothetical protein